MLCVASLISLSGCQRQNEQIYQLYTSESENLMKNPYSPGTENVEKDSYYEIDEITQGELTIYSSDNMFIGWVVKAFNIKYPNVKVSYNIGSNYDNNLFPDYTAKASVDMISGTAGDVIDIGGMPFQQFGQNNLLEDLYPYMENDPEFHKEDYYNNIFEAAEYDGKLWAIPMSFFNFLIRFNKTMLEENHIRIPKGGSLSYKDIIDIYNKIASNREEILISKNTDQETFDLVEYNRYFDLEQGKAYFDSSEFIEYISEMKKIRWPSRLGSNFSYQDYSGRLDENILSLVVVSMYHDERNAKTFIEHPSNLTIPIPMSASNGVISFFQPDRTLGISSTSKNKELAWKFIRFTIEEKPLEILKDVNIWPITGMPVNRNNTIKYLESAFGEENEEAVQIIDGWNSEIEEISFATGAFLLYEPIQKITDEFYAGRITAEDCARQIQERAEIYLKE